MTRDETAEQARQIARAVHECGRASDYVVLVTDDDSGLLIRRDLVRDVLTAILASSGGVQSGSLDDLLAQLEKVPSWQVGIVVWHENTLTSYTFIPGDVN